MFLIGSLEKSSGMGITATRLLNVIKRFFSQAADEMAKDHPTLTEKLQQATTHWMRHTHATHTLTMGAELITVRDNLRHLSISTTSTYLHGDDAKRSKQIGDAFGIKKYQKTVSFEVRRWLLCPTSAEVCKTARAELLCNKRK